MTPETELGVTNSSGKSATLLILACALLGSLFLSLGLVLVIGLIPLQWVYYKTGSKAATLCGGLTLILMIGMRFALYQFLSGQVTGLVIFDVIMSGSMMGSLAFLNLQKWKTQKVPAWLRVALAYTFLAITVGIAGVFVFEAPETRSQLQTILTGTFTEFGVASVDNSVVNALIDFAICGIPLVLLLLVVFNWYVTTWFWRRRLFQWSASAALAKFRVAEYMVWPLLVSLAGFAAGRMVSLPFILNTLLAMLALGCTFLYFLQGLGIIAAFFEKRRNPGMRGIALPLVCVVLFLVPGVNFFAMVIIPLVGVLEIWIRMRPATQTNNVL